MLKTRASLILVPFALCATGLLTAFVLTGCSREEAPPAAPAPAVSPSSPESYMHDRVFREKLSAAQKERQSLLRSRSEIVGEMKAMIDAKKAELGTDDLKKVKEVLDRDPKWQALHVQCTNANAKVEAHRKSTYKTVRERLLPKAGEGKISK